MTFEQLKIESICFVNCRIKMNEINSEGRVTFLNIDEEGLRKVPMFEHAVQCGFPSPADDFLDLDIKLKV